MTRCTPALFPRLPLPAIAALCLFLAAGCAGRAQDPVAARLPVDEVALASATGALAVPFTLDRNRIVLEVSLNGRDGFPFVLDTGLTDFHLLTRDTAVALGLEERPAGPGYDSAGRTIELGEALLPSMIVGELMLVEEPVAVMVLPPPVLRLDAGRKVAGVLGDRLLQSFAMILDFADMRMELAADPPPLPEEAAAILPLVWSGNLLVTLVSVNGSQELVMVDTGDFHTLTLYQDAAERLGLEAEGVEEEEATHVQVLGAAGPYMVRSTTLDRVGLAGIELSDVPAAIAPRGSGLPPQIGGRLGIGLLQQFRVTLDPANRRMVLVPRQDMPEIAEAARTSFQSAQR